MAKHCYADVCERFYKCKGMHAVSFGLGMAVSCFCPEGLTLFIAAVIIVALGIALMQR